VGNSSQTIISTTNSLTLHFRSNSWGQVDKPDDISNASSAVLRLKGDSHEIDTF
jgi:hypothetical protein